MTANAPRTVADALLDHLELEDVQVLFGIPGAAINFLLDRIKARGSPRFIVCRHETGAAYMAHGYSAVRGDALGVVLTTSGPGATNALTGALNAQQSGVPLLVITGEIAQQYFGRGYLQEGVDTRPNIDQIYQNAVEYSAVISDQANFATLFQQALRTARSLPGCASHISLPGNVAREVLSGPIPQSHRNYRTLPSGTDPVRVAAALDLLLPKNRPLILVGNGCRRALRDPQRLANFKDFVAKFAIPVMTTPDAKGIFPETHRLSLRNYGVAACAWPARYMLPEEHREHFDALLVLGSSLGELATSVGPKLYSRMLVPAGGNLFQVDLFETMIGRNFPIELGIVAETGATIDTMCALGSNRQPAPSAAARLALIDRIKNCEPFADPDGRRLQTAPIHPAALMAVVEKEMNAAVKQRQEAAGNAATGHIFCDCGNCVGWSLNNIVVDPPLRFHSTLNMGPMGFAVAAVVGGKLADPDAPCLAIVGDGAFLMHGAEVSTAARYKIGAVWVVLCDDDLRMVSQGMAHDFPAEAPWDGPDGPFTFRLGAPRLVQLAESLGARAVGITAARDLAALQTALRTALVKAHQQQQPQVIVVEIDPKPAPPYFWLQAPVPAPAFVPAQPYPFVQAPF